MSSFVELSFGFVYIWYDRKRCKFYVGSHHGSEADGYIASSQRIRRIHKKRPQDLRRRILERNFIDNWRLTRRLEDRWLKMIKKEELGKRYYNLKRWAEGGNCYEGLSQEGMEIVRERLSISRTGSNHHSARSVVIDGVRYETITQARIILGINPTKRLASKSLQWRNWYYEDTGPSSIEDCAIYDRKFSENQKLHLKALTKTMSDNPREWHVERSQRGASKRRGKRAPFSQIARDNIAKGHIGLFPTTESRLKMSVARKLYWEKKKGVVS